MRLNIGDKAYYDSFAGLLPCVILDIRKDEDGFTEVLVKLTMRKKRGWYNPGELILTSPSRVVPRKAVIFHRFGAKIYN